MPAVRYQTDSCSELSAAAAAAAAAAAKSLQSCPTLCDPIDGSPPGSPVPGILQARTHYTMAQMRKTSLAEPPRFWSLSLTAGSIHLA